MFFISLVLFIIIVFVILLFTIALKIDFTFDTNKENINLTILWLYPLLKGEVFINNSAPILKVSLFNIKVYEKAMKITKNSKNGILHVKDIKFKDINLTVHYGFQDKFTAGIVCGLINFVLQFFRFDYLEHTPDFIENNDYIYVKATAKANILPALKSLVQH